MPFVGTAYEAGIRDRKIAIVGYSHYYDDLTKDNENFTRECIQKTLDKVWKPRFFTSVRNAFGQTDDGSFWNSVMFFNYVPHMIGTRSQKFDRMTGDLESAANSRFTAILDSYQPDLTFVFTKKTALGSLGLDFAPMDVPLSQFKYTRRTNEASVNEIFRLRHAQGARTIDLQAAINVAMKRNRQS